MKKNPELGVRSAKASDISRILELECQMAEYHHKLDPSIWSKWNKNDPKIQALVRERWAKRKNTLLLVLLCNKEIVGYATFDIRAPGTTTVIKKLGYLEKLFVEKPYRKLGLGKKALQTGDIWFKKHGVHDIMLQVDIGNKVGVKTWQHLGFCTTRHVMRRKI